jgi:hypothetical protein
MKTTTAQHVKRRGDPAVLEMPTLTLRRQLIQAMGMRYDPLMTSVSESESAPDFGEIYVDPQPSLLDLLRQPSHALVFADYGMGKTATRLALEYALRNTHAAQPALCVTYTPHISRQDRAAAGPTLEQHLAALGTDVAIDLVIQLIERADKNPQMLSEQQRAALLRQAGSLPLRMRRRFRDAARASEGDLKDGIIWRDIRAIVRHVAVTPQWHEWVKQIAFDSAGSPQPVSWEQTLADARILGFPQIYILIDAVDEDIGAAESGVLDRAALRATVAPLLAEMQQFYGQNVMLKCFLPADLQELAQIRDHGQFEGLTVPIEIVNIAQVSQAHLEAIVNERLQAASVSNASFRSLDWFKGPDVDQSIQSHLAFIARGSPRRMIELSSQLLDYHSHHGFKTDGRIWLTYSEWQAFLARLDALSLASP